MNEKEAWNAFLLTGSVQDYLRYKSTQQSAMQNTADAFGTHNENIDGRTDNQTTEYR